MGPLPQFEKYSNPLLRGHLSPAKRIGTVGFFKCVEDTDYFLHSLILSGLCWEVIRVYGGTKSSNPNNPVPRSTWVLLGRVVSQG